MKVILKAIVSIVLLAQLAYVPATIAQERTLKSVLAQIDKKLRGTKGLEATVTLTVVTAGKDGDKSAGKFTTNMNDVVRVDLVTPDQRTILLKENTLYDYSPADKTAEQWSVGSAPKPELRYLNLGFGVKGTDLTTDFIVTLLESAAWNSRQTTVLTLVPKTDYHRAEAWSIQLRLDEESWLPVEQVIWFGSSQTNLKADYTDAKQNNNIPTKTFKPDWPSGTKNIRH